MARSFSGTDRVNHGSAAVIDNLGAATIQIWTKLDDVINSQKVLVSKGSFGTGVGFTSYRAGSDGTKLRFELGRATTGDTCDSATGFFAANVWTFVAYTFDKTGGNAPKLYKGLLNRPVALDTTGATGVGAQNDDSSSDLYFGNRVDTAGGAWPGSIAFVALYDRVMGVAELELHRLAPFRAPGCLIWSNYSGAGVELDLSGRGNHGVPNGTVAREHLPPIVTFPPTIPVRRRRRFSALTSGSATQNETGLGADSALLVGQTSAADTGFGTDAQSISGPTQGSEAGLGTDAQSEQASLAKSESGFGSDAQSVTPVGNPLITVDGAASHQTFLGWDATAQTGKFDFSDYALYKDTLADMVSAAGLCSFRLHINSRVERPDTASGPNINDNADPFSINWAGFQFQRHDQVDDMADFISLVKTRAASKGETVFVAINYSGSDEATLHSADPEEYAEIMQAAFIHMKDVYGWVPDAVEIINEPDFFGTVWTPTMIANSILATKARIAATDLTSIGKPSGWYPGFFVPSTEFPYNAAQWFNDIKTASATAASYVTEIAFHWYGAALTSGQWTTLQALAASEGKSLAMLEASETISAGADLVWDYKMVHMMLQHDLSRIQQYTVAYDWNDSNGAYFTVDHTTHVVGFSSRLKLAQNYFRWIRPGAVRKTATTSDANFDGVAFRNANGSYSVPVKCATGGTFEVAGLPAGTYHRNYALESGSYDQPLSDVTIASGEHVSFTIPSAGVATIYSDVPTPAIGAETGLGADAKALTGSTAASETGLGTDVQIVSGPTQVNESGLGADAKVVSGATVASDSGLGGDAVIAAPSTVQSESGFGADAQSVTGPTQGGDTGLGTDTSIQQAKTVAAEAGLGSDAGFASVSALAAENGLGSDAQSVMSSGSPLVAMTVFRGTTALVLKSAKGTDIVMKSFKSSPLFH